MVREFSVDKKSSQHLESDETKYEVWKSKFYKGLTTPFAGSKKCGQTPISADERRWRGGKIY